MILCGVCTCLCVVTTAEMGKTAKGWILTSRPASGPLTEEYFDFKEFELPDLNEGDFLVKIEVGLLV